MARHRILRRGLDDEVKRTILREAAQRFNHELLDDEERQVLRDRVLKIRRELGLQAGAILTGRPRSLMRGEKWARRGED